MLFWTIVKVALKSLVANKLRSFLAMLGIIIGVAAVIAMLALGAGARKQVMARISSMGTNLLVVRPGQSWHRGVRAETHQNLTLDNAKALLEEVPGIYQLAPVVTGSAQIKYYAQNSQVRIVGTSPTYLPIRNFEVGQGRLFTEREINRCARVAILGPTTVTDLFEDSDPLGEKIKIKGINFRVIGVLKAKGDQGWFNPDDQAVIPYTTAMKQLLGLDYLREIDIQAAEGADLSQVQAEATEVLRRQHRLTSEQEDDFRIRNQAEILETASSVTKTFTILLASIASISLLVGGIGIMNIMLVTVTERTREIGVRKALGAKDQDILRQFLIEALLMSGLGGGVGVLVGIGASALVERLTEFEVSVQLTSVLLAVLFSGAVGVFFGYYPARRAAMLDPIEALRYE